MLEAAKWVHSRRDPARQPGLSQQRLLDLLLRVTGQGSFGRLLDEPHGRRGQPHRADDFLGARVVTPPL